MSYEVEAWIEGRCKLMLRAKDWGIPPSLLVPSWEWVEVEGPTGELENRHASPLNQGNRRSGAVGQRRRVRA